MELHFRFSILTFTLALAACGGGVDDSDGEPSGSTGGQGGDAPGGAGASGGAGLQGGGASGGAGANGGAGAEGGSGGTGGDRPVTEVCAAMQLVTVSDPELTDENGDGEWSAGEAGTLTVTLSSPSDNFFYPGISVSHATADVTPNPAENWLFGLSANEPSALQVGFEAGAALPAGTVVELEAQVVSINEPCAGLDSLTFSVTIE